MFGPVAMFGGDGGGAGEEGGGGEGEGGHYVGFGGVRRGAVDCGGQRRRMGRDWGVLGEGQRGKTTYLKLFETWIVWGLWNAMALVLDSSISQGDLHELGCSVALSL